MGFLSKISKAKGRSPKADRKAYKKYKIKTKPPTKNKQANKAIWAMKAMHGGVHKAAVKTKAYRKAFGKAKR